MLLFAITTPVGIVIGLFAFAKGDRDVGKLYHHLISPYPCIPSLLNLPSPTGSANEIYPRFDVRHIRRHADLCCMRGNASRRLCDGCYAMAKSRVEADTSDRKPTGGRGRDGYHWVSVQVQGVSFLSVRPFVLRWLLYTLAMRDSDSLLTDSFLANVFD
jgi:hypothetical protein